LILVFIEFFKRGAILVKLFPKDKTYLVFNYCTTYFSCSNPLVLTFFGLFYPALPSGYDNDFLIDAELNKNQ